jgi:hypothetical protein
MSRCLFLNPRVFWLRIRHFPIACAVQLLAIYDRASKFENHIHFGFIFVVSTH